MLPVVLTMLAAAPDAGTTRCGTARCESFKSARLAFERVLQRAPQVLAVGEYHELTSGPKVKSAIHRFTHELVPSLSGKATSLIVETWMTNGKCGQTEKVAVAAVKKVTERPDTTEDEIGTLLGRTFELGIANHILVIDCDEYQSMLEPDGSLDAEKSLLLVRRKVEEKALEVREKGEWGAPGKLLILYGGALHNDLVPLKDWEPFSFGPSLSKATGGQYVELDLVVPELAANDEDLLKESWFAPALLRAGTNTIVLVQPHPDVYMLVFPRKKTPKGK